MENVVDVVFSIAFSCLLLSFFIQSAAEMGVVLLFTSLATAMVVGLVYSTWFGAGVWLVFISGLLVLFLFFCSVSPASNVRLSSVLLPISFIFCSLIYTTPTPQMQCVEPIIFVERSYFLLVWLVMFLLSVMIVVVKATPTCGGAMRELFSRRPM